MDNEELVMKVKAGEADIMELWARVRNLVVVLAKRRVGVYGGEYGVDLDDMLQA